MNTSPKVVFLVVICITLVTIASGATGAWLTSKGYQGGELLISMAGTGLGGLIAMLSSTRTASPTATPVSVTNGPDNPVKTQEQP